ncbi:T9SS type A sorting domain-containing protein [Mariniflexile sp.]|uniref:T9SS type A sorting domain-containing protein n=1 Tax=Mariniflexile sp. TaxID=1979402 RepID=UPI0035613D7B
MKNRLSLILILFVGISAFSQTDIITINPEQGNQSVTFGGDAKLTIKDWAEGNTNSVSQKLFGDMNLKVFRVPIFALQPISDAIYDNVISVINSVKAINPDVKIFASIANGDGYGNDYHGASKFPSSWRGCCPYNVYSLNLTTYSAYLDSFMDRMSAAGITVDYLGPYNEDPGDDSDYLKIIDQMTKLGTTKIFGLERWGLLSSVADVDDVEDRTDFIGSHFYDDTTIPEADWDATWAALVAASEDPVWYTESTRYKTNDGIDNLVAGMDNIFPAIRGGVEGVVFYQVCKRFVYANGSALPIKYTGFQNIVNNSEGKVINSTSNNSNIKVVVFGNESTLDVHIINKNLTDSTVDLQLLNSYLGTGTVNRKIWTANNTAQQSNYTLSDNSNWNIDIPANSYSYLKIPLNKSVLGINELSLKNNQQFKVTPNPSHNGHFQINIPKNNTAEKITLKIFTVDGRQVFNETRKYESKIELNNNLPSGMYLISVLAGNTVYNSKVIVSD